MVFLILNSSWITKIKMNMKNELILFEDNIWLQVWKAIESVIDILKHYFSIESLGYRSLENAMVKLLAGFFANSFLVLKPFDNFSVTA